MFEAHGIEVRLVNPRNLKNVPGKRTDFHACQWIQYLHSMDPTQRNVQFQHVISDLTGLTGLAILDALVGGGGTRPCRPDCGTRLYRRIRKLFGNRWKATGTRHRSWC